MVDVYLPADSQRRLIQNARETLGAFARAPSYRRKESDDPYLEAADCDAFITLVKKGELRGGIGACNPSGSLRRKYEAA